MQVTSSKIEDLRELGGQLAGDVVVPGDDDWDEARLAWNLAADQRPVAVAFAEGVDDVAAVVTFAGRQGLRVAPQGTGHSAGPMGALDDTILLKTSRMRGVEIDPEARRARVEAGVLWIEVTEAAAQHGLAALAGSSPNVGVVGYTTGGGMSWLARKYGLAANHVHAVELVTADGRFVRADHEHEPELFWAVRGGGGSFGVVTALEFELFPVAEVYAGWLVWPLERMTEVLNAWREWTPTVPDEVTSVGRILRLPLLPDIPEPFRGRSLVCIEATYLGDTSSAESLLAPLRALGPELDTFATMPASELSNLHMDPVPPVPGVGDGMLLGEFPAEAVDALAGVAGPERESAIMSIELRHLGGALAGRMPDCGAAGAIEGEIVIFSVGMAMSPEIGQAILADLDGLDAALAPWRAGRGYVNFTDRPREAGALFDGETHERLRRVKARYDSGNVIRANLPVQAAA